MEWEFGFYEGVESVCVNLDVCVWRGRWWVLCGFGVLQYGTEDGGLNLVETPCHGVSTRTNRIPDEFHSAIPGNRIPDESTRHPSQPYPG